MFGPPGLEIVSHLPSLLGSSWQSGVREMLGLEIQVWGSRIKIPEALRVKVFCQEAEI